MEFFEKTWPFTDQNDGVSTQRTVAEQNRIRILGLLTCRTCRSQRQLARATRLQPSTVSNIIKELKGLGIIRDGQAIKADRAGPKETELELVQDYTWTAGIQLDSHKHKILLINTLGHIIAQHSLPPGIAMDDIPDEISKALHECASRAGLPMDRLGGVGVSVPGVVNSERGEILISNSLKVRNFKLGKTLRETLNCPVWVDRIVTCGAYAERQAGAAISEDSFIYFLLRNEPGHPESFGLSIVIGEKIYHGCNSSAGEVDANLLSACFAHLDSEGRPDPASLDAFYEAYAKDLAGIINLLDVSFLILCSNDDNLTQRRFELINKTLNKNLIPIPERQFKLVRSTIGTEGTLQGAALLSLHRALAARIVSKK